MLALALKNAYAKGAILIAAVGNQGPKSPPLYPAADPHVIGVTAIDENDKLYKGSNIGAQVAVAAPGVDVMVPAPGRGLPDHHRHFGRRRACQRRRGAAARTPSECRCAAHPRSADRERDAARREQARRQGRLGPDRSARRAERARCTARRRQGRGHDARSGRGTQAAAPARALRRSLRRPRPQRPGPRCRARASICPSNSRHKTRSCGAARVAC